MAKVLMLRVLVSSMLSLKKAKIITVKVFLSEVLGLELSHLLHNAKIYHNLVKVNFPICQSIVQYDDVIYLVLPGSDG